MSAHDPNRPMAPVVITRGNGPWSPAVIASIVSRSEVVVPAFAAGVSYPARYLCFQFNYSVGFEFSMPRIIPVSGTNIVLEVRYRENLTTWRRKLWSSPSGGDVSDVYDGERVKGNFVVEVWSVASGVVSLGTAKVIPISLLSVSPSTYSPSESMVEETRWDTGIYAGGLPKTLTDSERWLSN